MKLHEKIKKLRLEQGLSRKELHRFIVNDFKEAAITYRTLERIEAGDTDGKGSSLHQICTALKVSLKDLKKDTEEENKPVDLVRKNNRLGRYVYNEKAFAELLIKQNRNFMAAELVLKPGGKTRLEQDPLLRLDEEKTKQIKQILSGLNLDAPVLEEYKILKFEKYAYCLKGKIICCVDNQRYILRKGDGLAFESSAPHWFENASKTESRCIIFQNPRYL